MFPLDFNKRQIPGSALTTQQAFATDSSKNVVVGERSSGGLPGMNTPDLLSCCVVLKTSFRNCSRCAGICGVFSVGSGSDMSQVASDDDFRVPSWAPVGGGSVEKKVRPIFGGVWVF